VNTLIFNEDDQVRAFSSVYIVDELLRRNRIAPQTFIQMTELLGDNPPRGAVGVFFELYALASIIRRAWDSLQAIAELYLINTPRIDVTAINTRIFTYESKNDDAIHLGCWYKPFNPSEHGLDAFLAFGDVRECTCKLKDLVIVFVQVTYGKTHKFDGQHFATAAMSICNKISGYEPPKDRGVNTRSRVKKTDQADFTNVFIEIIYAVPTRWKMKDIIWTP